MRPVDAWFVGGEDARVSTSYPLYRKRQIKQDGKSYVWLDESLSWIVEYSDGSREKFTALPGYKFDGASIPKIFQWFIGPALGGAYEPAACGHDITCESKHLDAWGAGLVFKFLSADIEVARWRIKSMWVAVRRMCQPLQNRYSKEKVAFALEHLKVESVF